MSIVFWRGDAPPIAQVTHATPANVEVGDVFRLLINGKAVEHTATAATIADVTAGLTTAWNLSKTPEHAEITANDLGTHVALVADKPGVPFLVAATTANGGASDTQTLTVLTTVASSGPNDWSSPTNWSGASVPVTGDEVHLERSSVSILYGLNQSSVALASLSIAQSFTGAVGLPRLNSAGYIEYRDQYLRIGAAQVTIGGGEGPGSGRLRLDTLSGATSLDILNSGQASDGTSEAVQWKGAHPDNELLILKGSVGIATAPGEVAQLANLRVGYRSNSAGDAVVRAGTGLALATLEQSGGQVALAADVTTVRKTGGDLTLSDGSIAALYLEGGVVRFDSAGTIDAAHVSEQGTLDFSRDLRARTVAACTLYSGARLYDPFGTVDFTTGIHLARTRLESVTLDIGSNRVLSLS